jgi:MFS family permease
MPAILKAEFNIGQGLAGVSATLYWQSAAIAGALVGGWLADRWMRRSPRGRIYVSAIGMSLIVPAMFGVGYAPQTGLLWVAIAFLVLFGLGWGFFDSNNMPILCQIARPELRATGYGIMNLVSISCGGFADWGFGALRDRQVPLFGIFAVFASAAILSIVLVLLIRPRYTEPAACDFRLKPEATRLALASSASIPTLIGLAAFLMFCAATPAAQPAGRDPRYTEVYTAPNAPSSRMSSSVQPHSTRCSPTARPGRPWRSGGSG